MNRTFKHYFFLFSTLLTSKVFDAILFAAVGSFDEHVYIHPVFHQPFSPSASSHRQGSMYPDNHHDRLVFSRRFNHLFDREPSPSLGHEHTFLIGFKWARRV
jgi:hypothetical protein